jgi:DNA-directed RNA polymerase sigma subunit (sigma70/sigma32)
VVRIPVHVQALYSKYKKLRQKLEYERGEEVTDEELAPMLGVRLPSQQNRSNTFLFNILITHYVL